MSCGAHDPDGDGPPDRLPGADQQGPQIDRQAAHGGRPQPPRPGRRGRARGTRRCSGPGLGRIYGDGQAQEDTESREVRREHQRHSAGPNNREHQVRQGFFHQADQVSRARRQGQGALQRRQGHHRDLLEGEARRQRGEAGLRAGRKSRGPGHSPGDRRAPGQPVARIQVPQAGRERS